MTFAIGHVEGGTNAGRRIVKPTPKPWFCHCMDPLGFGRTKRLQPAYMSRCPDCKTQRPRG